MLQHLFLLLNQLTPRHHQTGRLKKHKNVRNAAIEESEKVLCSDSFKEAVTQFKRSNLSIQVDLPASLPTILNPQNVRHRFGKPNAIEAAIKQSYISSESFAENRNESNRMPLLRAPMILNLFDLNYG